MEYLFNDVLEIKNGKNQKLVENPEGLYPIYGSGGIIGYADKYICEANTVIIGRKGSINNPIYVSEPFWNVDTAFGLSPKQDILLPRYLFYFCKNYNFEKLNKTVTIPSLTKADLLKIQIDLPSIDEQRRIVDKLIKVETIINLRNYQVQQLDDLIKARFIELFGDPQRNPHGYKHTKLSDIATYYNGLTYKPENVATEGTIVLRSSNIQNSQLDFADTVRVDCAIKERLMVQKNDILMCSRNGSAKLVGKVALIKDIQEPMSFGAFMMIIRSHYFGYLMTYFQMDAFRQQIKTSATTTINQITGRMLDDVTIPLPPMSLVDKFATFVEQIDKSKHHSPHLPNPPLKWYPLPKNEVPIMEEKIIAITNEMAEVLNIAQLKKLQEVLVKAFSTEEPERKPTNHEYLRLFLEAKSIEGCSPRTLQYYEVTVQHLFAAVNMPVRKMTTERMREYLSDYQQRRNCSKATIDNIRRNISSFFSWLEEEDHILKSPMRRIHKIKTKKTVKEVISDEDIEKLRDSCTSLRDLAMIDLLYSTGIRVGELVRLNIEDVNFESRECVVFGKGDKERRVYFDAKTKIHLKNYLESRRDTNRALFVSLLAPYNRLAISGVEIRLRKMGRMLNLKSIHPHKFRRTMATRAIDKGMPIEQVQKILGHSQIDTTMQYAIVNQNNVKMSHQKYIA